MFKNWLVLLALALSSVIFPVHATENPALAEEAKRELTWAGNVAQGGESNPDAHRVALAAALSAKKKWVESGVKDGAFEGIMENLLDALYAANYVMVAVELEKQGDRRGFEGAVDKACEHGLRSPMTDDAIVAVCKIRAERAI